jgi:hypothetical protein
MRPQVRDRRLGQGCEVRAVEVFGHSTDPWSSISVSRSSILRFELLDERSEMRGDGGCESVVLVLEAFPNC